MVKIKYIDGKFKEIETGYVVIDVPFDLRNNMLKFTTLIWKFSDLTFLSLQGG